MISIQEYKILTTPEYLGKEVEVNQLQVESEVLL